MLLSRAFAIAGSIDPARLRRIALVWCGVAGLLLAAYLARQTRLGLTDGAGKPFGEDFLNFWAAARLAISGQAGAIYDLARFHAFETRVVGAPIDLYHASYPPVMWLVSAPLGFLPYVAAWAVWQTGGWAAFALALRRIVPAGWPLVALAVPAVFVNAIGGQNGCWMAAIIGWGLILLDRRPLLAGAILALFVVKPQLGWLIPFALIAAGRYRALAAFAASACLMLIATLPLFGVESWLAYARQAAMLKAVILEDGSGTWHRMVSLFILVRHLGAPLAFAYAVQLAASLGALFVVIRCWRREGPSSRAMALLVVATLVASPYVSDYDCVMLTLAAAWLWASADAEGRGRIALALVMPLFAASLASLTGIALGALALWPLLFWAAKTSNLPAQAKSGPDRHEDGPGLRVVGS